ncbi:hypothetical protein [Aristaeella hokkaidonensis]|uniref:Uncharacterized protein n=1 Tax=Aristaeella hokkaidonensis TaxID=3046382 RepID=A0AC61N0E1_9FIRM|nr:hypothetical protein [Aristaeella hokkaidonensis]QUC66149.1 hypothetical protein JYE49_09735 [Aristaeella hokkaidonensis]SNT94845.1 hypothetical protein SAMN06297421_10773 [Aristaeella hokkaidonensis]
MIAPDVLLKPRQIRREIERKQMRIETLRRFAEHLTSPLREVRVKSTPDPTRMQALLAEAADEEKQLPLLEAELEQALAAAAIMVSTLPDIRLIELMELRYLEGRSWEETASIIGYSPSQTFKLHRAAMSLLPLPESEKEARR